MEKRPNRNRDHGGSTGADHGDSSPSHPTAVAAASKRTMNEGDFKAEPGDMDVVVGRGNSQAWRPGNVNFHRLLDEHAAQYHQDDTAKKEKGEIIRLIYNQVIATGYFLTRREDSDGYVAVSESEAKVKISDAMRYRRRRKRKSPEDDNPLSIPILEHSVNSNQTEQTKHDATSGAKLDDTKRAADPLEGSVVGMTFSPNDAAMFRDALRSEPLALPDTSMAFVASASSSLPSSRKVAASDLQGAPPPPSRRQSQQESARQHESPNVEIFSDQDLSSVLDTPPERE